MMKSSMLLQVLSFLSFAVIMSLAKPLFLAGCEQKCGNVSIPYPFGIGSNCSANSSFTVTCRNSTTPFLSSINMEALSISLLGTLVVKQPVSQMNCSANQSIGHIPIFLKGSPFTISALYNTLAVFGCKNSIWLLANKTTTAGGCTAMCDASSTETSCNGVNCCQTTIPPRLKVLDYTYKTNEASYNNSFCGYVFPVDKISFSKDYKSYKDRESGFVPLVLEWEFGELKGYTNHICSYADDYCLSYPDDSGRRRSLRTYDDNCLLTHRHDECHMYPSSYACQSQSVLDRYTEEEDYSQRYSIYDGGVDQVSSAKYCSCPKGYEGNPYLPEGCTDIDECGPERRQCTAWGSWSCINIRGDYICQDKRGKYKARVKIALISIGSGVGALVLLLLAWKSIKSIRRRINANRRRKIFKRNGGLLLEQELSATDNGLEKAMLYSSKELSQATDNFNENRILGRGGQGTVYKGMLMDGRIVAVKKSKKVEEGDLESFINEVVILSQVNHRNVVKLLGCCLETEVPLLVYEFVPNGTLLHHIHEPNEEFPLTWEMRLRIAREVAGALAYLHSSASAPIYHRDIKSNNILLDDKYRAKISDFGTSRSIAIDQTHLTTRVLGTFGYFDPEYFQSSHFTDKSDVYSFGVVMVELLTGEKAISSLRLELGRNLATHFVHSMVENQLFDILDAMVLREGKREQIVGVAQLARRCLHYSGKRRPTMKEVSAELEAIQEVKDCSIVGQNCYGSSRDCYSIEIVEPHDLSSSSESMDCYSVAPFPPEAEHALLGETRRTTWF